MIHSLRRLLGGGEGAKASGNPPDRSAALPLDLRDPHFVQDPYPTYDVLREQEPLHRTAMGAWMLTRYDDVWEALNDQRLSNRPAEYAVVHERNRQRYLCADVAANILPFQDPPEHTEPRKRIARYFHQHLRTVDLNMEAMARQLLTPLLDGGEMDVLEDFARPLSVSVMRRLLGLPDEDASRLERWSDAFFYLFAPMPSEQVRRSVDDTLNEWRQYFLELIGERRRAPGEDFVSVLANASETALSDTVIADNCMLLYADGVENVDAAIATMVHALLSHPRQWRWLRDHPQALPNGIEECLRYESPAQFLARIALTDIELHGTTIPAGSAVLLMLGAANRDPRQFTLPQELDVRRSNANQMIGFGRGRHSCIGARLVKRELEAALAVMFERCPDMALTKAPLVWRDRLGHRWPESVPVILP